MTLLLVDGLHCVLLSLVLAMRLSTAETDQLLDDLQTTKMQLLVLYPGMAILRKGCIMLELILDLVDMWCISCSLNQPKTY